MTLQHGNILVKKKYDIFLVLQSRI